MYRASPAPPTELLPAVAGLFAAGGQGYTAIMERAASPGLAQRVGIVALACWCLTGTAMAAPTQHRPALPPIARVAPLPPAVIDNSLTIGGDDIEGRDVDTRMVIMVQVNGHGPLRFAVDSGADTSVIGLRRARALQLPPGTPVMLHGTTGSSVVDRVLVDQIELGGSAIHDLELPVLLEHDLGADGLIGIDALVEQRLMLDFETHSIKVEDARRPAIRMDGEIVVVARRRRGQLILTQARANNRPVDAVIDTGSEITIGNLALRDQLLGRHVQFETVVATGVTGVTVNLQIARVRELQLGPVILQDVPVAFADVPPFAVFGLADHPALLLGTDLMATFRRVSLDFRARKVRFQLRRCRYSNVMIGTSPSSAVTRIGVNDDSVEACRR